MNVSPQLSDLIKQIMTAESASFSDLVKLANLDPARDFRGAMLRGVDFSTSDLSGFDFSNGQLVECGFRGAKLGTARFENTAIRLTDMSRAADWSNRRDSSDISLRIWSPEADNDEPSEERRVIGRIVSTNDQIAIVDFGHGLCRRIHRSLIETILESRSSDVGDTVSIPQEVVDTANSYFVDTAEIENSLEFDSIVRAYEKQEIVRGFIQRPIKGGFLANIGGFKAFLPGSRLDRSRRIDVAGLLDDPQPFLIIELGGRSPEDLVVSRIGAIEKAENDLINEHIKLIKPGYITDGTITSIQEYGVFVDIGGLDGLCHVSDLSWIKNFKPAQKYKRGDQIRVCVNRINHSTKRISLDHKCFIPDPWNNVDREFPEGTTHRGTIESIVAYGVFVRLRDGVTGLIHESTLSWSPQNLENIKGRALARNIEIDVIVTDLDIDNRRISLKISSTELSAVDQFLLFNPPGSVFSLKSRNWNRHELKCDLGSGVVGLVTLSPDRTEPVESEIVNLVVLRRSKYNDDIELAVSTSGV